MLYDFPRDLLKCSSINEYESFVFALKLWVLKSCQTPRKFTNFIVFFLLIIMQWFLRWPYPSQLSWFTLYVPLETCRYFFFKWILLYSCLFLSVNVYLIGIDMDKPLYISCCEHLITLIVIVVQKIMCIYRWYNRFLTLEILTLHCGILMCWLVQLISTSFVHTLGCFISCFLEKGNIRIWGLKCFPLIGTRVWGTH